MHVVSLRPIGFLQSSQAPFALMQPPSTVAGPPALQRANGWPCTMVRLSGISAAKPLLPANNMSDRCHLEKNATLAATSWRLTPVRQHNKVARHGHLEQHSALGVAAAVAAGAVVDVSVGGRVPVCRMAYM